MPSNPALLEFDKNAASGSTNWRQINVSYSFIFERKWNSNSKFSNSRSYISGLKYKDRFIDIAIASTVTNLQAGTISMLLNITNQKFPIETLYMGYVIYSTVNSPLVVMVVYSTPTFIERSINGTLLN